MQTRIWKAPQKIISPSTLHEVVKSLHSSRKEQEMTEDHRSVIQSACFKLSHQFVPLSFCFFSVVLSHFSIDDLLLV